MSGANHLAGGIVFTGVFASLWNINIFGSFDLLLWTGFASVLPDIDHPKSVLGKMFYPVSRWIDRNWGHRTITHSAIFLIAISLVSFSVERSFSTNFNYTTVLLFAVFSHFIFDMFTMQGIPFFYPFAKNPCVIPGNPQYRMRANDRRAELVMFSIFFLIGISCVDLFRHGFWTSYNRAFGTIKHVHRQNNEIDNFILVDYDYEKNENHYAGTAFLVASTQNRLVLLDSAVFILHQDDNSVLVNAVKPLSTDIRKNVREIGFFNISPDSLISLTRGRVICGQFQSSLPVEIVENNMTRRTSMFKMEYAYNFEINIVPDSSKTDIINQIKIKELKLARRKMNYDQRVQELDDLHAKLIQYQVKVKEADYQENLYQKNKYQEEIITLRREIRSKQNRLREHIPDPVLAYEIELLKQQATTDGLLFSGIISYPTLPDETPKQLRLALEEKGIKFPKR